MTTARAGAPRGMLYFMFAAGQTYCGGLPWPTGSGKPWQAMCRRTQAEGPGRTPHIWREMSSNCHGMCTM